jgi:hypothetical protein
MDTYDTSTGSTVQGCHGWDCLPSEHHVALTSQGKKGVPVAVNAVFVGI